MKFFKLFLFVIAVSVGVTSCSTEKDKVESIDGNKYESTYAKIKATIDGAQHTVEYTSIQELKNNDIYLRIEFKEDNTLWVSEDNDTETSEWIKVGTWSQKDSAITINFDRENITTKFDGGTLIMILVNDSGEIEWHFSKI